MIIDHHLGVIVWVVLKRNYGRWCRWIILIYKDVFRRIKVHTSCCSQAIHPDASHKGVRTFTCVDDVVCASVDRILAVAAKYRLQITLF